MGDEAAVNSAVLVIVYENIGFSPEMVAVTVEIIFELTPDLLICEAPLLTRENQQLKRALDSKQLFEILQYLIYAVT